MQHKTLTHVAASPVAKPFQVMQAKDRLRALKKRQRANRKAGRKNVR